ncbi:hypothetical protein [Streptomyces coelicoflavus]|uniref:hypothetical protein n=1 Tax=Streptomyces coelicoflavus TaxID=285562 RepID=UPI00363AFC65
MTADLNALTSAADRWDAMAGEFAKQEKAYRRDVHGISVGTGWVGLSADAANRRFGITLKEFEYAQIEAKAMAGLLRDAHTQFVDLRGRLVSARHDAIDARMKVSDQGLVSLDTERLSEAERKTLHHDPGWQEAVQSWQQHLNKAVQDIADADAGVKIALNAVVIDSALADGTLNGFNGQAQSDVETYEEAAKEAAKDAHTKTDGWVTDGKSSLTGPGAGFTVTTDPKYGKEGSVKAYGDLFHATAEGSASNGGWRLAGIADGYGGARATANYGFNDKGAVGKAEASAGLRGVAEGRVEYGPYAGGYGRVEGFAGAEAGINAKATKDEFTVGAKAFAGAKGTVAGGGEAAGIGLGVTAEGWAGPGAEAWWGYKKDDDGTFHLGGKAGASPILGGSVGVEITVDPQKVTQTVGDAVEIVGDTVDLVGDGIESVKDGITSWF